MTDVSNGLYIDSFALAKQVFDRSVAEFGSPLCGDVQRKAFGKSYDFWNQKEFEAFEEAGGHRDKCPRAAGTAARIAAEVLVDAEAKGQRRASR